MLHREPQKLHKIHLNCDIHNPVPFTYLFQYILLERSCVTLSYDKLKSFIILLFIYSVTDF